MEPITNRVAQSAIETFDLEALWPGGDLVAFDLAPLLYKGLVLRERDFRQALKTTDWSAYEDQHVVVGCSADAIVPTWAYMLVATYLEGTAASVAFGAPADLVRDHYARALAAFDWSVYEDKIVVVKGCGSDLVPTAAYLEATRRLQGVVRKIMYGEPCSAVPLWRKPKAPRTVPAGTPATAVTSAGVAKPAPPPGVKPLGLAPVGPPKAS